MGAAHALVNVAATFCYLGSWWQRKRGNRRGGIATGLAGYALSLAGAYLGGHRVYNERIGVNHAPEELPSKFVKVGMLKDLRDGIMKKVEVEGVPSLMLVRRGDGKFDGLTVECPWHFSRFGIDTGKVVAGPATYRQPCFAVRIRAGAIEVRAPRGMVTNPY